MSTPAPTPAQPDPQRFPAGFDWGCATSAYQIEGSPLADGAGASIWHTFSRTPGRILNGDRGDVACDHYRRMPEDVALMKSLGLTAYRFSINWGRVMPEGRGRLNEAGLGFYERLVDTLLAHGIKPMCTLYHWDLPQALDDRGGWMNPDMAGWFADYTEAVVRRLDDRVPQWVTINEPWVVADGGYMHGVLAPGRRGLHEAGLAAWNLLRANKAGIDAYRAVGRQQVGLVVNIEPKHLLPGASEADRHARDLAHAYMNEQYLMPAVHGRHPALLPEVFGEAWLHGDGRDAAEVQARHDFLGLNYYTRAFVRADPQGWPVKAAPVSQQALAPTMTTGWEVHPPALTETLRWMHDDFGGLPLYVTENGGAFYDPPVAPADGRIEDPLRRDCLQAHIAAVGDALAAGCDLRGYHAWSLFDNLEWAHGFSQRFGLVHVDFQTGRRTPKLSAAWYRDWIARWQVAHPPV